MYLNKKNIFIGLILAVFIAGCTVHTSGPGVSALSAVGFDLDDTLLFSTPAFDEAFRSGKRPFSEDFWKDLIRNIWASSTRCR